MNELGLYLFHRNAETLRESVSCGASGLIVDWERRGKHLRQESTGAEINDHDEVDLIRAREATSAPVICRINGHSATTPAEVEAAIAGGASEILLPMVREVTEVTSVLDRVRGRCGVGILIETPEAVELAPELGRLPLTRVFVGLNDLAIAHRRRNIFAALTDGTVERVRRAIPVPFGFGGLTRPHLGHPIPCRLLMGEMVRIGADFTFLRRSFWADSAGLDKTHVLREIREAVQEAHRRTVAQVAADRDELRAAIEGWQR